MNVSSVRSGSLGTNFLTVQTEHASYESTNSGDSLDANYLGRIQGTERSMCT